MKHNINFDDDSEIKTTEKRFDNVNKMRLNDDIRKEKLFIFWIELRQIEVLNQNLESQI